jgi:hypothetical protein
VSFSLRFIFLLLALPAWAQTNNGVIVTNSAAATSQSQTKKILSRGQQIDAFRADCIQHRRTICGKILKVLPDGLVVESGYTNLMRAPLNHSWLAPGSVQALPAANLVEGQQPDCVCVGLVFLTNLPKKPVPKVFDYVDLTGYPAGSYTYTSVGDLRRTVRKFSAKLSKAVQWNLDEREKQNRN